MLFISHLDKSSACSFDTERELCGRKRGLHEYAACECCRVGLPGVEWAAYAVGARRSQSTPRLFAYMYFDTNIGELDVRPSPFVVRVSAPVFQRRKQLIAHTEYNLLAPRLAPGRLGALLSTRVSIPPLHRSIERRRPSVSQCQSSSPPPPSSSLAPPRPAPAHLSHWQRDKFYFSRRGALAKATSRAVP